MRKAIIHRVDVPPETIAFTGGELADLIAASIEETIALDTTPKKKRVITQRTSEPPPPPRPILARPRQPVSTSYGDPPSIPPVTFTPPSGIPRLPEQRRTVRGSFARSIVFGGVGVMLGLAMAVCGWHLSARVSAAATQPTTQAKRTASDAKLAVSSPTRDKATKKPVRRLFVVPQTAAAPAPPAPPEPGLDKLGDEMLNRPF